MTIEIRKNTPHLVVVLSGQRYISDNERTHEGADGQTILHFTAGRTI